MVKNMSQKFNKEKFKSVIHYIINKCDNGPKVGRTVLYKLLYFSEFNYFELFEKGISNEVYKKYPRGPVPIHFLDCKNELIAEGKIKEESQSLELGKKNLFVIL